MAYKHFLTTVFLYSLSSLVSFGNTESQDNNKETDYTGKNIQSLSSWFIEMKGGTSAFFGVPYNRKHSKHINANVQFGIGYWINPSIATRIAYQSGKFRNAMGITDNYHLFHADVLYDVSQLVKKSDCPWKISPFLGIGMAYNPNVSYFCPCSTRTNDNHPFAFFYGIEAQYRINKHLGIVMEIGNMTTSRLFDGYGSSTKFGDNICSINAGVVYNFHNKKTSKKEELSILRYKSHYNNTIKKDTVFVTKHKQNCDSLYYIGENIRKYIYSVSQGTESLGTPVFFFFRKGQTDFTDDSQIIAIDELAKFIIKHKLKATVVGAADAATGNIEKNLAISKERALTIKNLLIKRGVSEKNVSIKFQGGINKYHPVKANRNTYILLSF